MIKKIEAFLYYDVDNPDFMLWFFAFVIFPVLAAVGYMEWAV